MKTKSIDGFDHIKYEPTVFDPDEMIQRAREHHQWQDRRRSVRQISSRAVSREVIDSILLAASTAPSGAHKQPWTFCVIEDKEIKKKIRSAAEAEEKENYESRMSDRWLEDLKPFATNWEKPFLEEAPYLIAVFKRVFEWNQDGEKVNNYYVNESVGIACGMLISAIHHAGLVTLTHTPSPMNFLSKILDRPENERPYLLLPVGYADDDAYVPVLRRKGLKEIAVYY